MANGKDYFVSPGWKVLLHDLGLNPGDVLRRANLPGDLFVRDKSALSQEEYFRLWKGIDEEADYPCLSAEDWCRRIRGGIRPAHFCGALQPRFERRVGASRTVQKARSPDGAAR